MTKLPLPFLVAATALLCACSSSDSAAPVNSVADSGTADCGPEADVPADSATDSPTEAAQQLNESEPNNGATDTEYNDLPLDAVMTGVIGSSGDTDIFRIPTSPGKVYEVSLIAVSAGELKPHLTVIDDGQDGKSAGEDYVKIMRGDAPLIDFLAMGTGGYFVAVRDARNVDDSNAGKGGPTFQYKVQAHERSVSDFVGTSLSFPSHFQDQLSNAGAIRLYPFQATENDNVVIDLQASGKMDPRLLIFAESEGSWIARNDNRSATDTNPLIDAPLTAGGKAWLVVENIQEDATQLGFTVDASK